MIIHFLFDASELVEHFVYTILDLIYYLKGPFVLKLFVFRRNAEAMHMSFYLHTF